MTFTIPVCSSHRLSMEIGKEEKSMNIFTNELGDSKREYSALPYYAKDKNHKFLLYTWRELVDDLSVLAKLKRISVTRLVNELLLAYTMTEENRELLDKYKDDLMSVDKRRKSKTSLKPKNKGKEVFVGTFYKVD